MKRNLQKISPDDTISIRYKIHGSNATIGKVLCRRPLSLREKFSKFFGAKIQESFYDLVFSSRTVIKNQYADQKSSSYYDTDIWKICADKYKDCIEDGVTLYGEICGQMPNGSWVQKLYDYGLPPNTVDFFVFRITYTNSQGKVLEFTALQVERYCQKYNLKTPKLFYYGQAQDLNSLTVDVENHWHENFLETLIAKYTEKTCFMCRNKLPEEGVVLVKEGEFFEGFKLKSFAFLERETKELDSGEISAGDAGDVENSEILTENF